MARDDCVLRPRAANGLRASYSFKPVARLSNVGLRVRSLERPPNVDAWFTIFNLTFRLGLLKIAMLEQASR